MSDIVHLGGEDHPHTMSTMEIADLTGKRHDHVMRDAKKMLTELYGEEGVPKFGDTHRNDQNGQVYPIYRLPKRESLILVSGYNLTMRARIIDRWQELESQTRDPIAVLNDPSAMRGLLLTYSEKVLALQPKADALDRIATADGSLCITDAAKALQVRPKDLFGRLQSEHWIYRRTGGKGYLGYQAKVQSGLVEHKVDTIIRPDGSETIREQVRITPKGLAKLAHAASA